MITQYEVEAHKKGLPFAGQVAYDDFKDELENWKKELKRLGYANKSKPDITKLDWKKYSDLKNFELIEEGEQFDSYLSKRYGMDIHLKQKTYKFKGYSNIYTIMENPNDAVLRSKKENK
jgi:hypothetical protein